MTALERLGHVPGGSLLRWDREAARSSRQAVWRPARPSLRAAGGSCEGRTSGVQAPAATGGVLNPWRGLPEGCAAAHVRLYLDPWAAARSGRPLESLGAESPLGALGLSGLAPPDQQG